MRAPAPIGLSRGPVPGGVLGRVSDAVSPRRVLAWSLPAATALAAIFLAQQFTLGRSPFGEPGEWTDVWVALVHCFGAAYLPAAYLATLVSGRQTVLELRLQAGNAGPAEVADLPSFGAASWPWLAAGVAGSLLTLLGPWLTEPDIGGPLSFWMLAELSPEVFWHRLLGLWIGFWMGWFGLALGQVSHRLSRLAREAPELDLFDAAPLRPFVRHGLSNGLTAAGLATFIGLLGFDMGVTMMLAVFGTLSVALVVVAVALPLSGVQSRIRLAKDAELAWCSRMVREESARVRSRLPGDRGPTLSDLLAYRHLVESVATWPLDTPALRRVLLYLIIPLLTWILSALVEALTVASVLGS